MAGLVFSILLSGLIYSVHGVLLKSSMNNNYPQVVVRGCESQKSNLFYDNERKVWMEDLTDSCRDDEEQILEFCQKVYSTLSIENIVRLDSPLSFGDWCDLNRTETDLTKRCKIRPQAEAIQVKPFRCLHKDSQEENSLKSGGGCVKRNLQDSSRCQRIEKWNQKASDDCSKFSLILSSEVNTVSWCQELAEYSAVEFLCCPFGDSNDDTSEEQEDEAIPEPVITAQTNQIKEDSKSRSRLSNSDEPEWMKDEPNWPRDSAFFADDEDMADEQNPIPLSSLRRSNLTIVEHDRFTQEKKIFQDKYQAEIEKLKSLWQQSQSENKNNPSRNTIEKFRQNFEILKQRAKKEQRAINELHENNLDRALDLVEKETNQQIEKILLQKPFQVASFEYWTYQYLHALLRDRIHLVNRYERLQATDAEEVEKERDAIHQRLKSIAQNIDRTLLTLKAKQKIFAFTSPAIDQLIDDYQEVNSASERLLSAYNKISNVQNGVDRSVMKSFKSNSQDYDRVDRENDFLGIKTMETNLKTSSNWISDRDWILSRKLQNFSFQWFHLVYLVGAFGLTVLFVGIIIRCHRLLKLRNSTKFRSNYFFTPVESSTLEEKSLRDLQLNGYENPTYKYFEQPSLKC